MLKLIAALTLAAFIFARCDKDASEDDESIFYGTWVKGSNTGDTLVFQRKDGNDVMIYNQSFNPALPAFAEAEYSYKEGKLYLKNFWTTGNELYPITSFQWQERGRVFQLQGHQINPFLSSTQVQFVFRKVR